MRASKTTTVKLDGPEIRYALGEYILKYRPELFDGKRALNITLDSETAIISQSQEISRA